MKEARWPTIYQSDPHLNLMYDIVSHKLSIIKEKFQIF